MSGECLLGAQLGKSGTSLGKNGRLLLTFPAVVLLEHRTGVSGFLCSLCTSFLKGLVVFSNPWSPGL